MDKHYTVSDGNLVLYLWPAEEGGYNVTSPLDPGLITQAESFEEAWVMAYDAQQALRDARAKLAAPSSVTLKAGQSTPLSAPQSENPPDIPDEPSSVSTPASTDAAPSSQAVRLPQAPRRPIRFVDE